MKIKVIYNKDSKVDTALDKIIMRAIQAIGFKFYASGCNRINGERDLSFSDGK